MNPLAALIEAGAVKSIRGYALEAVRGPASGVSKSNQSPLVRAVKALRREFNIATTRAGYELARSVYRRAVTDARRADRETSRQVRLIERGIDPGSVPYRGPNSGRLAEYTVFVELTSSRSNRTYRGQVKVVAAFGTSETAIAQAARDAVLNRTVESMRVEGSANYGITPIKTWQVADYSVNSISFIE